MTPPARASSIPRVRARGFEPEGSSPRVRRSRVRGPERTTETPDPLPNPCPVSQSPGPPTSCAPRATKLLRAIARIVITGTAGPLRSARLAVASSDIRLGNSSSLRTPLKTLASLASLLQPSIDLFSVLILIVSGALRARKHVHTSDHHHSADTHSCDERHKPFHRHLTIHHTSTPLASRRATSRCAARRRRFSCTDHHRAVRGTAACRPVRAALTAILHSRAAICRPLPTTS